MTREMQKNGKNWNYSALCFQSVLIIMVVSSHANILLDGPADLFPVVSYFVQGFAFISGYLYSDRKSVV